MLTSLKVKHLSGRYGYYPPYWDFCRMLLAFSEKEYVVINDVIYIKCEENLMMDYINLVAF